MSEHRSIVANVVIATGIEIEQTFEAMSGSGESRGLLVLLLSERRMSFVGCALVVGGGILLLLLLLLTLLSILIDRELEQWDQSCYGPLKRSYA